MTLRDVSLGNMFLQLTSRGHSLTLGCMAITQGPFYKALGDNIRSARTSAGLTQARLASTIGFTRTSVTNIESGKQPVEIHVLVKIAQALGCPPSTLIPNTVETGLTEEKLARLPADVKAWVTSVIAKPKRRRAG